MAATSLFIKAVADVVLARVMVFDVARDLPAVAVLDLTAFFVAPWDAAITFVALRAARVLDAVRTCVDALRALGAGVRALAVRTVLDCVARPAAFTVLDCVARPPASVVLVCEVRPVTSRFGAAESRRALLVVRVVDEPRTFDCARAEFIAARFATYTFSCGDACKILIFVLY